MFCRCTALKRLIRYYKLPFLSFSRRLLKPLLNSTKVFLLNFWITEAKDAVHLFFFLGDVYHPFGFFLKYILLPDPTVMYHA